MNILYTLSLYNVWPSIFYFNVYFFAFPIRKIFFHFVQGIVRREIRVQKRGYTFILGCIFLFSWLCSNSSALAIAPGTCTFSCSLSLPGWILTFFLSLLQVSNSMRVNGIIKGFKIELIRMIDKRLSPLEIKCTLNVLGFY